MVSLVAFSGVDGAGKSTQIDLLREALEARQRPTRVFWARGGYTPVLGGLKALTRRFFPRALPEPGRSSERVRRFASPRLRRLWLALAILDLGIYWGLGLRAWRRKNGVAIADRYISDSLLDFKLNFPQEHVEDWWLWRMLCRCVPRPSLQLVLVVPVEESEERSRRKNEPFSDPPEVRMARLEYYERLETSTRVHRVDCCRSREAVRAEIWELVEAAV